MNKTQLVDAIAAKSGLTKADAKKALDAFIDVTAETLKNDKIQLVGFGTFSVNARPERTGRNPQTKETIKIPAKKLVKFKAGADLESKIQ
ncbi:MAG: HU family DNA-binding protein [Bacteroidales bacterium]|nr:HU family DNA-binding protein [Bacteroidales bacterium]